MYRLASGLVILAACASADRNALDGGGDGGDGPVVSDGRPAIDAGPADAAGTRFALTVVKAGAGPGVVTSAPAGIDCGDDCTESFAMGRVVLLTATGGNFTGWSGGCAGVDPCTVTMNAATTVTATFAASTCDAFTSADTTTIPGWTERAGDWSITNGRLRDAAGMAGTFYGRHITRDDSMQTDGCARFTAGYVGTGSIVSVGAILRWTSPASYVVALVQDNTNSGTFNTAYIYQYPGPSDIGEGGTAGTFGTSPHVEVCVAGSTVTMRIDAAGDGTYETTKTGTTTLGGAGLTGAMTLMPQGTVDDFCWGP